MGDRTTKRFKLSVTHFTPCRGSVSSTVSTVSELRAALAPAHEHHQLAIYLDRDEPDADCVLVHITGDRAWVTHMTMPGGIDSYCRDTGSRDADETIGFILSNGQLDPVHRGWTVPRANGLRALEHFVTHGDRDPSLDWVEQPQTLLDEPPPL